MVTINPGTSKGRSYVRELLCHLRSYVRRSYVIASSIKSRPPSKVVLIKTFLPSKAAFHGGLSSKKGPIPERSVGATQHHIKGGVEGYT